MSRVSITYICDYAEEGWPSMDLLADTLPDAVAALDAAAVVERLRPRAPRYLQRLPGSASWRAGIADRLLNRYVDYPRWLRAQGVNGDRVFHVLDHTYAHLVELLPAHRTLVTCHDLDAFRCLLYPASTPRPWWFRALVRRTLNGLRAAGRIACVTEAVREELVSTAGVERSRTMVVANAVHPAFSAAADPLADAEAARLLGPVDRQRLELLHVGLPIPRKRIDRAIEVLAAVRARRPDARLIRAGGSLPAELRNLAARSKVLDGILELPFLTRAALAAVYRRASVVLVTSDLEGFGLPVLEGLACGVPVIASDIPSLRETGGDAVSYCAAGDLDAWRDRILAIGEWTPEQRAQRGQIALDRAAKFTWRAAADAFLSSYRELNSR